MFRGKLEVRFSVSFIKATWREMACEKHRMRSEKPTKGFVTCKYTII